VRRPAKDDDTDTKVRYCQRLAVLVTAPLYVLGFVLLLAVGLSGVIPIVLGAAILAFEFFRLARSDGDTIPNCRL
jgi:hypothetical protein